MRPDEAFQQEMEHREWYEDYDKTTPIKPGENRMNINDVYTSNNDLLKASDLQGKTIKVVIEDIEVREFDAKAKNGDVYKQKKFVLAFKGKEKKLAVNKTNAVTIGTTLGEDTDSWLGKEIKIFPTKTTFGDQQVDCIRVVSEQPPEAFQDDDIPEF